MVPEDRKKHGIIPIMGVGKNITLSSLPQFCFGKNVINEALEETVINQSIQKLKVKPLHPN
ncbi:xylose transporter ATP-binding subunit [Actinobacillus pleuropneumoniae]|nr:xylose transporter ATP-binding subunit [Actinobacillus pleuropneumoniae]